VLILLSTAWATTAVSFLPRSLRRNKSNGTTIIDSDVVTVPGAPSLPFSLDYWTTSFHCCQHLTTISRGPIDQFLHILWKASQSSCSVQSCPNRHCDHTSVKGLCRPQQVDRHDNKRSSSNFSVDFFCINTLALQGLKGGEAFCCI
jgi:hypothetical protein